MTEITGSIQVVGNKVTVSIDRPMWPSDAIMVIASVAGKENRAKMESVHHGHCRDCGCQVAYDGKTQRAAESHPLRQGRPVMYFCWDCHLNYDFESVDDVTDHR